MDARFKFSRLIGVLCAGEELAAHVALSQSRFAPEPWMRRALEAQAQQERGHARAAAAVATLIRGRGRAPAVLARLGARLEADLQAGNLAGSLIGLQGVIEHLGETLLERLGRHPHPIGALLHPLRERVLAQERGHARLGAKCLVALAATGQEQAFADYAGLGLETARAVADLLEDTRVDADGFWREVAARLAGWRRAAGLPA